MSSGDSSCFGMTDFERMDCMQHNITDMSDKHVFQVSGFTADFTIKVESTWCQTSLFDDCLQENIESVFKVQ